MPLDIEVKGDPASLRATAAWLRRLSGATHDAGTTARGAVGVSESGWTGAAGDAFRAKIGTAVVETDGITADNADAATALEKHADDLDTVRARMAQAWALAIAAGLVTTDEVICEPAGPAPADVKLPDDRVPTGAEVRAFGAARSAVDAYDARKEAFDECVRTVAEADRLEKDSQSAVEGFFAALVDGATHPATLMGLDLATSATGAHVASRVILLSEAADHFANVASSASGVAARVTAAGGDRVLAWYLLREAALAGREKARATAELSRLIGPYGYSPTFMQNVRRVTTMTTGDPTAPGLSRGQVVLRSVSRLGVGLTAAGVAIDIYRKPTMENAIISTAAGGASLYASTAVGVAFAPLALTGAPVLVPVGLGLAVGFVVSLVVKEFGDEAVDVAEDAGKAIGNTVEHAAKRFVKGLVSPF